MSTGDGLALYNGQDFQMIRENQGLAENFTTVSCQAKDGSLWVGHFQTGVSVGNLSKFKALKFPSTNVQTINALLPDKAGYVWIGTNGNGLIVGNTEHNLEVVKECHARKINALALIGEESMLAGTDEGLFLFKIELGKIKTHTIVPLPSDLEITALHSSGAGNLEIGFTDGSVLSGVINGVKFEQTARLRGIGKPVKSICRDSSGNIWVATYGNGLKRILPNSKGDITPDVYNTSNGLAGDYLLSLGCDYEGNMWIGTYGTGLSELIPERFIRYGQNNGLLQPNVISLAAGAEKFDQSVWLGLDHGLVQLHTAPNAEKRFTYFSGLNGFVNDAVTAMLVTGQTVWAGTANSGLYRLEHLGSGSERWEAVHGPMRNFTRQINCLALGSKDEIFIGTVTGLIIYNPLLDNFKVLTTSDGLAHNNIRSIHIDAEGVVWLASHGAGLTKYTENTFTIYKDIPGLRSYKINSITSDQDHNIWFATEGDGVFSFDGDNDFNNYTTTNGLVSNYCYSILADSVGEIWVGHRGGLSCLKPKKTVFAPYSKQELFPLFEANPAAVCLDLQGRPWWGTIAGAICYETKLLNLTKAPRISIDNIMVNNSPWPMKKVMFLPYNKYALKFEFSGISLSYPDLIKYTYRLEGFEEEWNEGLSTQRVVSYPRLEDGTYTFKVLACNNEGVWSTQPATYSFRIGAPYYKRWPFYVFVFVAFVSGAYGLSYARTKRVLNRNRQLEALVNERTSELKEERDKLEKSKNHIEEINKDITESIYYARRIQDAVLPARQMQQVFSDRLFIFHRPREIVSGDFYWFAETNDGVVVVVADSTGHGVPGAFMSLIGTTLLNQIVVERKVHSPAQIIEQMNNEVVVALHQNAAADALKDGMDMAVVHISPSGKVTYSGACRPLYYVRDGELKEIQGSFSSVGGNFDTREKVFKDTEFQGKTGDMLYLFTDGYADQFGGAEKRRFMTKRLKALLAEISGLPLPTQARKLEQSHTSWKQTLNQTDDMLVLGIRLR